MKSANTQKMEIAKSPAERGEVFPKIPQLCLQHQGELDLFEPQTLLNILDWNINNYPTEVAFIPDSGSLKFAVDVNDKEQVIYQTANQQMNLSDLFVDDFLETKPSDLVNWLDRHIEHADTPRHYMLLFLGRIVDDLLAKPNVRLVDLLRNKFVLARAIDSQMNVCRNEAKSRSYQQALFSDNADVQACFDAEFAYEFKPENYVPQPPFYSGRYQFSKHFFAEIENLKASGEEFECAKLLDMLPEIKYWVRNPDLGKRGFWLPLSNRRFFPDFICELQDGRIFIAEYKGEAYKSNDDSKEKCTVGEYWAAQSGGKGVFAMLVKQDELGRDMRQQILAVIQAA
ncbi:hypothetical protein [Kingella negevensis]|uniref:hypothetical protein n=2 Tax=Kingella negevensis TaxID=1522312 RepID=UPI00254FDED3|nr:hypothetical protein [Kingella negevensis]MDK4691853.1 hypothetical protein [Kingella negevensis]